MLGDKKSPRVGKFTYPSGAPNNDLLTVWSPGPVNHQYVPQIPSTEPTLERFRSYLLLLARMQLDPHVAPLLRCQRQLQPLRGNE